MIVLRLPVPPSTNNLFLNIRRGRAKSRAYRDWLAEADKWFLTQKRGLVSIIGPRTLEIKLPKIRGDASNRIKAAEDYLVSRGITGDDKNNRKVSVEIDESLDCCEVTIKPA